MADMPVLSVIEDPDLSRIAEEAVGPTGQAPTYPGTSVARGTQLPSLVAEGMGMTRSATEEANRTGSEILGQKLDVERKRQAATAPYYAAIEALAAEPPPTPPKAPPVPEPPRREFRPFLDGVPGESPLASIQRVLGGLALLATQVGSAITNTPNAALAAMTGALNGWAAGDEKRGDAEFETYKAQVNKGVIDWQRMRQEYEDVLKQRHTSLESLTAGLRGVNHRHDQAAAMYELADRDTQAMLKRVADMGVQWAKIGMDTEHIALNRELAVMQEENRRRVQEANEAWRQAQMEQRQLEAAQRAEDKALDRESRERMQANALALQRELGQMRADAARERAERGRALPAKFTQDLGAAQGIVSALDKAFLAYRPEFVGPYQQATAKGFLGINRESLPGAMSPQESSFRQFLEIAFNAKSLEQGGKVLTANELTRVMAEMATAGLQPANFLQKLTNIRNIFATAILRHGNNLSASYTVPEDLRQVPPRPMRPATWADWDVARKAAKSDAEALGYMKEWGFDTSVDMGPRPGGRR